MLSAQLPAALLSFALTVTFAVAQTPPPAGSPQGQVPVSATTAPSNPIEIPDLSSMGALRQAKLIYPLAARNEKLQGQVILKVLIDERGKVESAEVVGGHPILAASAIESIKKWEFAPYIRDGKAVQVRVSIPFNFACAENVSSISPPNANTARDDAESGKTQKGFVVGSLIYRVNPAYPPSAKANDIQGAVVLATVIGKDGRIKELKVISGPEELRQAALDAVQQW